MNAPIYILRRSIINRFKEILRKPGKLVSYSVIFTGLLALLLFTIFSTGGDVEELTPIYWFTGALFAFMAFLLIFTVKSGLSSGDTIFEMNDANLLFVSPVNSRKILLYGIVRMARTVLLSSLFILFQTSILAGFGIGFGGVLLTFFAYSLSMVVMTITTLLIFSLTNGNPVRKRNVKIGTVILYAPLVVLFTVELFLSLDFATAVASVINSPLLRFFPIAGWTAGGVTALLSGEVLSGLGFLGLNLLLGIGITVYILLSNPDYYEDVLVATETAYEKARVISEGNIEAAVVSGKNYKIKKTGISGVGASAFFGKHLREAFRKNRFGIFNLFSLFSVIGAAIVSYFVRDILTVLQILMWIQIFMIGTGRGLIETYSHYIYMVPESSFSKIIWSNLEQAAKTFIEGVLIFMIGGLIIAANPLLIIACILAYTLYTFLLLGVNYLYMRYTGTDISNGLLITIYFIAVILFIAPGVALGVLAASFIGGETGEIVGVLVLAAWELGAGVLCFSLSKGVLHDCDMATMKPNK